MIQLWVLPEVSGQAADYKIYQPVEGELTRIYGGKDNSGADFPAQTKMDVAVLSEGQQIEVSEPFVAYITRGKGYANNVQVEDGDLMRGNAITFKATDNVQLIIVHTD